MAARFVFWYAFPRFFIDLFRDYPTHRLALGTGQTLNIVMGVLGVAVLYRSRLRRLGRLKRSAGWGLAAATVTARPEDATPAARCDDVAPLTSQRLAFAGLLAFCLTIPSNWTQDVPARYGGRHPGLGHSWLYPKLDTAPPATHPRDAPAATRGMAAEDMRRPRRRPHGRPRSGDEEVAIRGFDSNTRAVRSAGSLREPTDNGGNGPGIGEWKPGNAVGAGSRRPVGWVRTASVGVVSASAAA